MDVSCQWVSTTVWQWWNQWGDGGGCGAEGGVVVDTDGESGEVEDAAGDEADDDADDGGGVCDVRARGDEDTPSESSSALSPLSSFSPPRNHHFAKADATGNFGGQDQYNFGPVPTFGAAAQQGFASAHGPGAANMESMAPSRAPSPSGMGN